MEKIVQTAFTISYHGKKVYIQNTVENENIAIFYQEKKAYILHRLGHMGQFLQGGKNGRLMSFFC